jgi:hypothetical protein
MGSAAVKCQTCRHVLRGQKNWWRQECNRVTNLACLLVTDEHARRDCADPGPYGRPLAAISGRTVAGTTEASRSATFSLSARQQSVSNGENGCQSGGDSSPSAPPALLVNHDENSLRIRSAHHLRQS